MTCAQGEIPSEVCMSSSLYLNVFASSKWRKQEKCQRLALIFWRQSLQSIVPCLPFLPFISDHSAFPLKPLVCLRISQILVKNVVSVSSNIWDLSLACGRKLWYDFRRGWKGGNRIVQTRPTPVFWCHQEPDPGHYTKYPKSQDIPEACWAHHFDMQGAS
jgi:hypothetical protein